MALLEGEHLTKKFGGIVAVDDVSFSIDSGETVGLIGPNGAGKSTLFRLISGVQQPNEGRVVLDGEEITGQSPHEICQRGLVRTHQIVHPFENLTLLENAAVGAQFGSRGSKASEERAHEVLEFVGLEDMAYTTPDELSVGALKRLEIARALATDPEVLLFDEVAGGLDTDETEAIVDLIGDIADRGKTVFLIDHVMRALMSVSDRVLVLDNASLIATGTPEEIQNNQRVIEAYLGENAGDAAGAAGAAGD
ncbi:ABC transporter ATP-binding protein [Halobacterium wangiae]|uniref:ABC transporter ATP-binding protein n=1 Tax=Halobacterium wangiae TaxID=2902623 RepID=UPI001E4722C4|nr:ABC transporter ATP-binding protein [Halobacterium wangiae]